MAIDKAVRAIGHGDFAEAVREMRDFGHETVTKGFRPLNTNGLAIRALKAADAAVHGFAVTAHAAPYVSWAADVATLAYGAGKFAIGKMCEVRYGKGGLASDVKAAGRLSMTFSAISLCGQVANLAPGPGPVISASTGVAAHGAMVALSLKQMLLG